MTWSFIYCEVYCCWDGRSWLGKEAFDTFVYGELWEKPGSNYNLCEKLFNRKREIKFQLSLISWVGVKNTNNSTLELCIFFNLPRMSKWFNPKT